MATLVFETQEDMDDAFEDHMEIIQNIAYKKEEIENQQNTIDDLWEQHKEAVEDMNLLLGELRELEEELTEYE